jgi:hypothetical protein
MRSRWIVVIVGLLGVALVAVGCRTFAGTPTPTAELGLTGRFRVDSPAEPMPEEEPVVVIWGGYTAGHRIGATSPFTVSLENVSERTEEVRFCLKLLDRDGVVAELAQRRYTLNPSMILQTEVPGRFPDDIDRGAYGVALVVRDSLGPDAGVVNVAVGEGADAAIDIPSDAVEAAVEACPPAE